MKVKVAINGYGTIGKRVADAVSMQDDMVLIGVSKRTPNFDAFMAQKKGYPFYAPPESIPGLESAGIKVEGTTDEMLERADIVIDATPKSPYKELYAKHGIKAIWQGGEKHDIAGISFNAVANYDEAWGQDKVRVVSCNTTGLIRSLYPLQQEIGVKNVLAVLVRRATDPGDSKKGPINAIEPVLKVPSHHGPDVKSVMKDLDIQTTAVKVPTTIMHMHSIVVKLDKEVSAQDVLDIWSKYPRLALVDSAHGVKSTAQIMEMARGLGRPYSDLYEIAIWKDGVHVVGDTLYYYQAVHQESDVVPENIDAVRAMMEMMPKEESMKKTDESLGIGVNLH